MRRLKVWGRGEPHPPPSSRACRLGAAEICTSEGGTVWGFANQGIIIAVPGDDSELYSIHVCVCVVDLLDRGGL